MQEYKFTMTERIILGIDPGTNVLGYGILKVTPNKKPQVLAMGVIDLRKCTDVYLKLGRIYERVMGIIDEYQPNELAIEAPFFGKNVQSMLKLGRAQGVTIAAAISKKVDIYEYAPLKVKQMVTGCGQASKEQVAKMMQMQLQVDINAINFLDATDAIAVAYCHYLLKSKSQNAAIANSTSGKSKSSSWQSFLKLNEDRIHKR